ncbi:TPA: porin, partial [Klebsiella pneumoniae subsp. pneumoniae]|nr:porin [Klebsiella pneumoniae subsp. pneumoniae]
MRKTHFLPVVDSGAHLNPVVSLIFYLIGACSFRATMNYIVAQLLGAGA